MRKAFRSLLKSVGSSISAKPTTSGQGSKKLEKKKQKWHRDFLKTAKSKFEETYQNHSSCPRTDFKNFKVSGILGSGRYSTVVQAEHRQDSSTYAIKIINKEKSKKDGRVQSVILEKRLLHAVDCDFIIKLHFVAKDSSNVYFVMEHAPGGDLSKIEDRREKIVRHFAAQIILALEYLHTCDVLYRDLKPENVLLFPEARVKLCDLGSAVRIGQTAAHGICGCPEYMAPEVLRNKGYRDPSDWWSFGVLLFDLLLKKFPFNGFRSPNAPPEPLKFPSRNSLSSEVKDLIGKLLEHDEEQRMGRVVNGESTARSHAWFRDVNFIDVLEGKNVVKFKHDYKKKPKEIKNEEWAKIFPNVDEDLHEGDFVEF